MNLSGYILKLAGWKVSVTVPDYPKAVICVAPHTSNWDFVLGKLAYASVGRKAGFLMKKAWFFFPLGCIFRAIGGVPVDRSSRGGNLVDALVKKYCESSRLVLAITPEGTRSRTTRWHTGFLRIAHEADIPVEIGVIDASTRTVSIDQIFIPTGNIDADLAEIKKIYRPYKGIHPENFTADE